MGENRRLERLTMAGWDIYDHQSNDATAGGVVPPPAKAHCASCNRRRLVSDMRVEENHRSGAFNYLVCGENANYGGCFEGPYPELQKPEKTDDTSPIPNIYY